MGKGDKRSKKGKRRLGSYGNSRRRKKAIKKAKGKSAPVVKTAKKPAKKAAKK